MINNETLKLALEDNIKEAEYWLKYHQNEIDSWEIQLKMDQEALESLEEDNLND